MEEGMISDTPSIHRANFLKLLHDELQAIGEDSDVAPKKAYARLVLATLGYDFVDEQYSDGSGEYGIDYWDSSEETSVIFQFKSTNFSQGIDESRKVVPGHLTDIPRILNTLKAIDGEVTRANKSLEGFLNRIRHNMRRYYESPVKHDEYYGVSIYLAVLASSFTPQAKDEFDRQCEEQLLYLKQGRLKLSYNAVLIDDLINEKWKSTNTEWKDSNGKNRNFIELSVCNDKLIDEAKSYVFFTKAIDLVEAYNSFGFQIFEPNVRCEVPRSKVNDEIKASVNSYRGRREFHHLNNGITMICSGLKKPRSPGQKFRVTEPGIINGLQTIKSIADAYNKGMDQPAKADFEQNCSVMVRLHTRNSVADYRELVKSTNNQNPMQPRNLHSNDAEQVVFERLFADLNWFYERKQGAWAAFKSDPRLWKTLPRKKISDFQVGRRYRTVDNEDLAQCWLAFLGFSEEAVHNRREIFQREDMYEFIFLSRPLKHGADQNFEFKPNRLLKNSFVHDPK